MINKKIIRNIIFLIKIDIKGRLKGNILAFLKYFSVTFALQTCGRKLANEPKSDRNIPDLVSVEQYTREEQIFSVTAS